jgi:AraC-like DNA-binding protein
MRQLPALVRSGSLDGYVELVRSLGRDPYVFMRSVGLDPDILASPEMLVPRDAVRELLEITARATRTPDFALRLASQRKLSALGPISLVLREDPTPRAALDTLCRYLKLVNTSLSVSIEDTDSVVIIREDLLPTPGLPMRQSIELAVGTMFRMLRELIGEGWQPREVCFTHRAPEDLSAYRAFFGRRVKFNQDFNGMVCLASDLSTPRRSGDQVAAGFVRKHLEAALVDRNESVEDACRKVMLALLPGGGCTAAKVASFLHVDRRTLHRRLESEGLTFTGLLHQLRSELVQGHLRDTDLPLGEVADLLGFSGLSSFSHWFGPRFGCSPSQWRKKAALEAAPP